MKAPRRVSDVRRVSCERTRTVETTLFYTLSVKSLNINTSECVASTAEGWVVLYCSEGIQTGGEAVDWQPLPTDRVFPLGLSYIRRGREFRIEVFECMDDEALSGCVYPTESEVDSRHGQLIAGWTVALGFDTPRCDCTAMRGQNSDASSSVSPLQSWLRCHVDFEGEYSMVLLPDPSPSSQYTNNADADADADGCVGQNTLLHECLDDIERTYYGEVWTRRIARQECTSSSGSNSSKKHLVLMHHVYTATRRIAALQNEWQKSYAECKRKRDACVVSSDSRLKQLHHSCLTAKATYEMLTDQLDREKESITLRSQKQKVKSQALMNTLQALVQASSKVCSSKVALQGMDGQGRVDGISKQLHSRQDMMLAELARVYNIVARKIQVNTSTARRANDAGITASTSIGTQMDVNWTGRAYVDESSQHDETASSSHIHHEYTIQGLHVDSSVWKHAFSSRDADDYPSSDPVADKNTSIALGYVAHIVLKASHYLGIPLRYPIIYRGSHSTIMDNYDPAASNTPSGTTCSEFPLHCYATKDRPRFAIAVFLLYKNILQLLQTHYDTEPPVAGPNHIMSSLYTLLHCSD